MGIWAARLVLASFWLISGVIGVEMINATPVLAENAPVSSQLINGKPISVSKAEFGVKIVDSQGKVTFFPRTKVQLQEGEAYGWRIQLQDYRGEVKWREVLRLPKPPETWGTQDNEDFSISADGTTAVSKRTQSAVNGVIENFWTIAPGDPVGKHKIEVYIDDRLIKTFEFEIVQFNRV
ncbi:hypothetical protein Cylst_0975 [Cylindrospermum stagnale PCC 7417]|uniref:Uncharacterized protein n=1 Tax=Cylindrospermum stagnale PCC 7417 TaxID=56107 RepID=K9WU15_9NOST|nr:hypothetical protein [Cylindrospermum stagnale]AFZ23299.1 hypothetical protein Cylst_0975 [Cylindrospermum stagnale PCC 7417]